MKTLLGCEIIIIIINIILQFESSVIILEVVLGQHQTQVDLLAYSWAFKSQKAERFSSLIRTACVTKGPVHKDIRIYGLKQTNIVSECNQAMFLKLFLSKQSCSAWKYIVGR